MTSPTTHENIIEVLRAIVMHHHLRQAIATVLASEFDRGRRSGIEQAAETAEDTDYHGKIPLGWTLAVDTAADKIRALLTNPEKTI